MDKLLTRPGPEILKLFSYLTQLSMKFFLLIYIKMPTIVGILIFISRKNFMLNSAVQEKKFKLIVFTNVIFYRQNKFHSQLSWAWKKFYNLGPRFTTLNNQEGKSEAKLVFLL